MNKRWIAGLAPSAALMLALATAAFAATPKPDTPRYDTNAEYTIRGTVVEIRTHTSTAGYEDMHVMLKTSRGVMEVHLAPVAFLAQHGVKLAKDDAILVTGSKTAWEGTDVIVARDLTKRGKTVEVRDADGVPLWPRTPRG